MTTTFERLFSVADISKAIDKFLDLLDAENVETITAGELRQGMTIVEKVNGKRRFFRIQTPPLHKGHAVFVTVHVNNHRLNWRYENEAYVHITGIGNGTLTY